MKKLTSTFAFTSLILLYSYNSQFKEGKNESPSSFNLYDTNYIDEFKFIDKFVKNKTVICIGESSHGVNEFNIIKGKLIKYLNARHGFKNVVFESGLTECAYANFYKEKLESKDVLKSGLFSVWQTNSNINLIDYVKKQKMNIYGIDNQISTDKFLNIYNYCFKTYDVDLSNQLSRLDSMLVDLTLKENIFSDTINSNYQMYLKLSYEYLSKVEFLIKLINENNSIGGKELSLMILKNKKYYFNFISKPKIYYKNRDSVMAQNFIELKNKILKGEKVILWAHNSHVSKTGLQSPRAYLGRILNEKIPQNEIYSIGIYAFSGTASDNFRRGEFSINCVENSLESKLYTCFPIKDSTASFVDLKNISFNPKYNWIYKSLPAFGYGFKEIVPIEEYNALILAKSVKAASLIK
ncbi:MAG: erythromycin esterase family protein [Bacteroidetes bacterium]|nr:erythromycin esterase family protein [Bacteroidota bacterium]